MRTRTRGFWNEVDQVYSTSNPYLPHSVFSWPVLHSWETMYDWVPSTGHTQAYLQEYADGAPRRYRVNPCIHERWEYIGGYAPDWFGDYGHWHSQDGAHPAIHGPSVQSILPPIDPGSLSQAHMEAFNAFNEQFPQRLSGGEFAQGIRDFATNIPRIVVKMQASLARAGTLSGSLGSFVRRSRPPSASAGNDVAAAYLSDQFVWAPLLADLEELERLIENTRSRLAFLKKTYGQPTKLRFSKRLPAITHAGSSYWEPLRGWGWSYVHELTETRYTATATLRQFMTHLDDAIGWIRALTAAFGFDNPAKAIWEMLPFSFLIDWLLDVSTRLDGLSRVHPSEPWDLSGLCWSVKSNHVVRVDRDVRGQVDQSNQLYPLVGKVLVRQYRRDLGVPADWAAVSLPSLTPHQWGLALALGWVHNR